MASANRSAYILDSVRGTLDNDTDITVVKVWRNEFGDTIIAYPHLISQAFLDYGESGYNTGHGMATVNILIHDKVVNDASGTGVATDQYGAIVQKVEELFENMALPIQETHTGGLFATTIHSIRITSWDGLFDNNAGKVMTACSLEVQFTHTVI